MSAVAKAWYGEPEPDRLRRWQRGVLGLIRGIERAVGAVALAAMALLLALAVLTTLLVLAGKLAGWSSNAADELRWHLFAAAWLPGLAWALRHDAHVRIDSVYARLPRRGRALIDATAILLIALPLLGILAWYGGADALRSLHLGETSSDDGLGARWLARSLLPLGALLLAAQCGAVLGRAMLALTAPQAHPP
jgi:TRAP-type mannitol/chloroaromatic compound transport system permease small subunit